MRDYIYFFHMYMKDPGLRNLAREERSATRFSLL
jgi:hypothetical protein